MEMDHTDFYEGSVFYWDEISLQPSTRIAAYHMVWKCVPYTLKKKPGTIIETKTSSFWVET